MKPGLKYLKSAAIVDGVAVALTNGRFRIAAELNATASSPVADKEPARRFWHKLKWW